MHGLFKFALVVFTATYLTALVTFAAGRFGWLEPVWMDRAVAVMAWQGQPWIHWFELQVDAFGSPFINILVLSIFLYLSEKRRRNR